MVVSSVLSLFMVPVLYVVIVSARDRFTKRGRSQNPPHDDDTNLDGNTAPREEVERDRVAPL
jgi:HAE1 family hydrophobic/amphiphilic exporter-1